MSDVKKAPWARATPLRDPPAAATPPLAGWPKFVRARDLAWNVFPASEETLLQLARRLGVGRKLGRAIIFTREDCNTLYEALPECRSSSSPAPSRLTGSFAAPSAASH
jgi:hypothetical protein